MKFLTITVFTVLCSVFAQAQSSKYKVMIQMNNYTGKEAYVVVSLTDPKGNYEKTLSVLGDDDEWYNTLKEWHKARVKSKENVSAVTGASIAGGARAMKVLNLDASKFNKGYKIRFESAVETQKYIAKEVEVPLTVAALETKEGAKGSGYIRNIRFVKVQ